MLSGIFWLDDGTSRGLEQAVSRAAEHFRSRFHREPTLCLVPSGMLHEGRSRLRGLAVREHSTLPPRHLWIGIDDAREPSPHSSPPARCLLRWVRPSRASVNAGHGLSSPRLSDGAASQVACDFHP